MSVCCIRPSDWFELDGNTWWHPWQVSTVPPTSKEYTDMGLPWFDLYDEHIPALHLFQFDAGQVDGSAIAGGHSRHGAPVRLRTAHARCVPSRQHVNGRPFCYRTGYDRARTHQAKPLDGKSAIDRQSKRRIAAPRVRSGRHV